MSYAAEAITVFVSYWVLDGMYLSWKKKILPFFDGKSMQKVLEIVGTFVLV